MADASGCGMHVKDYGYQFRNDPALKPGNHCADDGCGGSMSDERSASERNLAPGPPRISDEPATRKPLKLPNTPINGFGPAADGR